MNRFSPQTGLEQTWRPMPFWSWNDTLNQEELRRQVRLMHQAGIGGFFMHARGGLGTEYLSREYLECISAAVEEALRYGMEPWLYDENGWPSGYGGGRVNGMGEEFQQKFLQCVPFSPEIDPEKVVACYRLRDGSRCDIDTAARLSSECIVLHWDVNPCYVDLLHPEVTDAFIASTYEFCYANLPEHVAAGIAGVFTDEPQLRIGQVFYSPWFYRYFSRNYHCDIRNELIKLYYDYPGSERFRQCFYRAAGSWIAENYTKKIQAWCQKHRWRFTGHQVQEVNYAEQTLSSGAVSFHYPFYDMPGIDHLGRNEPDIFVARQMTSIAAQFARKRRMVEMYAGCGWELSFERMRWMYNLMQVYGINFLCTHLSAYSLRGLRKRDYPPSFGCHEPWFDEYGGLNEQFARTSRWLGDGKEKVRTLVLHAQRSVWSRYRLNDQAPEIRRLIASTRKLVEKLADGQEPFHFGFEPHLEEYGEITDGQLQLGECIYSRIILPEICNMSRRTLAMLRDFQGELFRSQCEMPLRIDGIPATPETQEWFERLPEFEKPYGLMRLVPQSAGKQLRSSCTEYENGRLWLVVNRDFEHHCRAALLLPEADAGVYRLEEQSGALKKIPFHRKNASVEISLELPGGGALWLWTPFAAAEYATSSAETRKEAACSRQLRLPDAVGVNVGENYLILDRLLYSVDGGGWCRGDISGVQWELLKFRREVPFRLRFPFCLNSDFTGKTALMIESPERFQFRLNGAAFRWEELGYRFDPAFHTAALPRELMKCGENILELSGIFSQSSQVYQQLERCRFFETEVNSLRFDFELEAPYLSGDFSVKFPEITHRGTDCILKGTPELGAPVRKAGADELIAAGLPFFAGRGKLTMPFEWMPDDGTALEFSCRPWGINSIQVSVNGRQCGMIWERPWRIALPPNLLVGGQNLLQLECVVPLRNLLGPHHSDIARNSCIGPGAFCSVPTPFNGNRQSEFHSAYRVLNVAVTEMKLTAGRKCGEKTSGQAERMSCGK